MRFSDYNCSRWKSIQSENLVKQPYLSDLKRDCFKDLCIPYNEIWSPSDPVDNLGGVRTAETFKTFHRGFQFGTFLCIMGVRLSE